MFKEEISNEVKRINEKITNRNNILKWVLIFTLITITALILLLKNIIIDLSSFDFSDLLAVIVSLWAMYISVLFYHNAQDSSTRFYDNMYKFIRDISRNIASLDSSVSEKLKGLKESVDGGFGKYSNDDESKMEYKSLLEDKKKLESEIKDLNTKLQRTYDNFAEEKANKNQLRKRIDDLNKKVIEKEKESTLTEVKLKNQELDNDIYALITMLELEFSKNILDDVFSKYSSQNARLLVKHLRDLRGNGFIDMLVKQDLLRKDGEIFKPQVFRKLLDIYNNN